MKIDKVWEVVDLSMGRKPINYKWIFKKKPKLDESVEKYKARLVAQGFTKKERVDYNEAYSRVSAFSFITMLMTIFVFMDLELYEMNVKNFSPQLRRRNLHATTKRV